MAPVKSAAERMREYRQRMTVQKKTEAQQRNAAQQRKRRANFSIHKKKADAIDSKIRMRKMREKRKAAQTELSQCTSTKAFSTKQSFGRAMSRVNKSLPRSPRKKRAVVVKLAESFGMSPSTSSKSNREYDALSQDTIEAVTSFYTSDLISRQLPGKKDFKKVKTENGIERKQKRVLMMTVMEAYQLFKQENPSIKIGKSKFAALRPVEVTPSSEKDQSVCCCRYHENGDLLITGISKVVQNLPVDTNALVVKSVCKWEINCLFGMCEDCNDINSFVDDIIPTSDEEIPVTFYQWNTDNKKVLTETTLSNAKQEILNQLPMLRRHCFVSKTQLQEIKFLKGNLSEDEAILHEDFSENFNVRQQNEIMSAHWISEGITIFTAIVYRKYINASYVVVSDELAHDKFAVMCFNSTILNHNISTDGPIANLHFFSDGAGSQFKNRFTLSSILKPHELHPSLKFADWSFFGTAHGKGAIDGIGGTVKRAVWRRTLQNRAVINTAHEFFEVAKEICPNINFIYISKEKVKKTKEKFEKEFALYPPKKIPDTHRIHYVKPVSCHEVETSIVSPFSKRFDFDFKKMQILSKETNTEYNSQNTNNNHFKIGDYLLVNYDTKQFPGIVEEIQRDEFKINVMHPCRGGWHWPSHPDCIWYNTDDIEKKLSVPQPINARGTFKFSEDIL